MWRKPNLTRIAPATSARARAPRLPAPFPAAAVRLCIAGQGRAAKGRQWRRQGQAAGKGVCPPHGTPLFLSSPPKTAAAGLGTRSPPRVALRYDKCAALRAPAGRGGRCGMAEGDGHKQREERKRSNENTLLPPPLAFHSAFSPPLPPLSSPSPSLSLSPAQCAAERPPVSRTRPLSTPPSLPLRARWLSALRAARRRGDLPRPVLDSSLACQHAPIPPVRTSLPRGPSLPPAPLRRAGEPPAAADPRWRPTLHAFFSFFLRVRVLPLPAATHAPRRPRRRSALISSRGAAAAAPCSTALLLALRAEGRADAGRTIAARTDEPKSLSFSFALLSPSPLPFPLFRHCALFSAGSARRPLPLVKLLSLRFPPGRPLPLLQPHIAGTASIHAQVSAAWPCPCSLQESKHGARALLDEGSLCHAPRRPAPPPPPGLFSRRARRRRLLPLQLPPPCPCPCLELPPEDRRPSTAAA